MFRTHDWECRDCRTVDRDRITKYGSPPTGGCPECGSLNLTRLLSAPRVGLDPISGDFPGATLKWSNNRKIAAQLETKRSHYDPTRQSLVDY